MEEVIPPKLKPGEKIHYCIFHDETCMHANDQCTCVWQREGEQPLRDKSRGRITHVSDYIIEHCRHLCLSADEITAQLRLPVAPLPPPPPSIILPAPPPPLPAQPVQPAPKKSQSNKATAAQPVQPAPKKSQSKKATAVPKPPVATRCTLANANAWMPPPPPAPFTSYRLPSFDAR